MKLRGGFLILLALSLCGTACETLSPDQRAMFAREQERQRKDWVEQQKWAQGAVQRGIEADRARAAKEEADFAKAAQMYRDAAIKPEIPEETRRFKVKAEAAVAEKRFDDAAGLYAQGLALSPWWPEGRYNRALVLAETRDYARAVAEMKRYLVVAPDSAQARAAKDKIYVWEDKVR